jgi:hypothetical protein
MPQHPHRTRIDLRNRVLNLFLALQNLSAAQYLPSPTSREILLCDLLRFSTLLISDDINVNTVVPLFQQVIRYAADEDIWNTFISLVSLRAAPPTIFNKASLDTALKSTSSSQQGSEQIHDEIDPRILQEINGCVYQNTKGFYEKSFERRSWSPTVETIVCAAKPQRVNSLWTEYPNPPSQKAFLD